MAMGQFLEEALANVLYEGKSLEEVAAGIGGTKKLYLGFSTSLPKCAGGLVTWASVKECKWGGYTARTLWPGESGHAHTEKTATTNAEGTAAEVKNKEAITVSGEVTTSVTNPELFYVFWADKSGFEEGNVWFWAKLANKATVEVGSTEGVKFEPKILTVSVT